MPSKEDTPALTPFEVSDLGQGLLRLRRLAERLRDDPAWRKANDQPTANLEAFRGWLESGEDPVVD